MKINELIQFKKFNSSSYTSIKDVGFEKKHGFIYAVNINSYDKQTFMNYIDKDCVVSYFKGDFGMVFSIKVGGGYKFYFVLDDKVKSLFYNSYSIFKINKINLSSYFNLTQDKKLVIVDEKEHTKMLKQIILESVNGN